MASTTRRPVVLRKLAGLRRTVGRWRADGERIALVPTMGALHAGHLALVRLAHRRADRVVVSIFVNPAQFAPSEDFASYPRTFAADVKALREGRGDLVWAPTVAAMYPDDFALQVVPEGPATVGLEDAARPHFFAGVATVVAKLSPNACPTSPYSARRITSSSASSRRWRAISICRSRSSARQPCASRTGSPWRRATST